MERREHELMHGGALLLLLSLCAALAACNRSAPEPEDARTAPDAAQSHAGLTLSAQDIAHLGLVIAPAAAAQYIPETEGFGLVLGRDVIAQPLADIVTARAAARQSHAAQARMRRLSGTPGADSALARESADRQTVADDAALELAEAKAAAVFGQRSPWTGAGSLGALHELGAGRFKILRVTFPLGSFTVGAPQELHVQRIDGRGEDSRWRVTTLWPAPADTSIPGLCYFAVLAKSDLTDGERLLVRAMDPRSAPAETGVFIPNSALVISADHYWAYRRHADGSFGRVQVDTSRPLPGGYFVTGLKPGDPVVTSGAGMLLAREKTNSASDADP